MADSSTPGWISLAALGLVGILGFSFLRTRSAGGDSIEALLIDIYRHGGGNGITWEAGRSCRTGFGPEGVALSAAEKRDCLTALSYARNIQNITEPGDRTLMLLFLQGYNSTDGVNPYAGSF